MNKLSSLLNWLGNTIGANPSTLTTTSKTLVGAINEINKGVPVGAVEMFAGANAPSGWLPCQGQAVSRTTYAALFTAIGTTYGAGDGSTTFNLPDFRDRMPIGTGNLYALNARGGNKDAIVPYHRHSIAAQTISYRPKYYLMDPSSGVGYNGEAVAGAMPKSDSLDAHNAFPTQTTTLAAHNTNYEGTSGNAANANLPPYRGINFIIFTGV